eukprot:562070-Hanusia_phi.AAC.1
MGTSWASRLGTLRRTNKVRVDKVGEERRGAGGRRKGESRDKREGRGEGREEEGGRRLESTGGEERRGEGRRGKKREMGWRRRVEEEETSPESSG